MIDAAALLKDLQALVGNLETDLRTRAEEVEDVGADLRERYQKAKAAERTALAFEDWRDEQITQSAVSWILTTVFVRFLEDNGLIEEDHLSGTGDRRQLALDQRQVYFREHPEDSDREYLVHVFRQLGQLPGMAELFVSEHVPLWHVGISGDGAKQVFEFWQRIDPETGDLVHDFRDEVWGTRFLGDLYQDLSESARKKYALLQTPEFVEEFILSRTLEPALEEFGLKGFRMIDPTCGSGHFLLGSFARLLERWRKTEPSAHPRDLVQRALDAVHGVDLNPYAVAITRFRLLLAALREAQIQKLTEAPAFRFNIAAGDSLLHGGRGTQTVMMPDAHVGGLRHAYAAEDLESLAVLLETGRYQAVVGNPPYIRAADPATNEAYRKRWESCSGKYSLVVPFLQRFFSLCAPAAMDGAGFVGAIVGDTFMKRKFGRRLIETFLPTVELTHVIDTSGAYIPGHTAKTGAGTTTAILIGRARTPCGPTVRAVLGKREEPSVPADPVKGLVWTAITQAIDVAGYEDAYISVQDIPRERLHRFPWSLTGGAAPAVMRLIESAAISTLASERLTVGQMAIPGEDDAYVAPNAACWIRRGVPRSALRPLAEGDCVRDWQTRRLLSCAYPYDSAGEYLVVPELERWLWPYRRRLESVLYFKKTKAERGMPWPAYAIVVKATISSNRLVNYAFVATHNHFCTPTDDVVCKQSVLIVRGDAQRTDVAPATLLGPLNSSVGCFWARETFKPKGGFSDGKWEERLEWDATKMVTFPLPAERSQELVERLLSAAKRDSDPLAEIAEGRRLPTREGLYDLQTIEMETRERLIALQEELDWRCYVAYGLVAADLASDVETLPGLKLGERAFEIVLARGLESGALVTTWFERHASLPITTVPLHWPEKYRRLVERRVECIAKSSEIELLERREYKRRWSSDSWSSQVETALGSWLRNRIESEHFRGEPRMVSVSILSNMVRSDSDFMQVATLYKDDPDFDVAGLVAELVASDSVPFLPVLRYASSGLEKRRRWETTWELQRQEDAINALVELPEGHIDRLSVAGAAERKREQVGVIATPPRYAGKDYSRNEWWRLRGKLDTPKERFISFPGCGRELDPSLPILWAGWDHLQQAQALSGYYVEMKEQEGWPKERLVPLLAGLLELAPWLKQWHDEVVPEYGVGMGTYFAGFVEDEARSLAVTLDEIRNWSPA